MSFEGICVDVLDVVFVVLELLEDLFHYFYIVRSLSELTLDS